MIEPVVQVKKSPYEELSVIFKIPKIKARVAHFLTVMATNSIENTLLAFTKHHFSLEDNLLRTEKKIVIFHIPRF